MDKKAIKKFAVESRKNLRQGVISKLAQLGITDSKIEEVEVIENQLIKIVSNGNRFYGKEVANRAKIVEFLNNAEKSVEPRSKNNYELAFEKLVEEVAYTWFNRLIAIRFMEVNNYLPERLRVLSSETPRKKEPDIITNILETELYKEMSPVEKERVITLISENSAAAVDELYQLVFIKQCNSLNKVLPNLFEKIDDYTEQLINISYIDDNGVIASLLTIPESDFNISQEGQIEIIGWMYQYYNTEPKDKVFARGNRKIRADEIPAATQLFTPEWIVRYMVENSLGRYYIDRKIASATETRTEKEIADSFGWKYYLPSAEQPEEVQLQILDDRKNSDVFSLQELKLLDNAMGSGHVLVYAFDVLMQLYISEGYRERDAAELIIENNLFGLEIDKRAYQIAYFAIMMKGRQFNRRILTKNVKLNLFQFIDSSQISAEYFTRLKETSLLSDSEFNEFIFKLKSLLEQFKNATEIGSILKIQNFNIDNITELKQVVNTLSEFTNMDFLYSVPETQKMIINLLDISTVLISKYEVIVTNPPYLNKMSLVLEKYVKNDYSDVKTDLFSIFIKMNSEMLIENGYAGFMTPFVWMFIKSYEQLRTFIINNKSISSLIQMEYSAFEEATVPVCSFTIKNTEKEPVGSYFKLSDFKGGMKIQEIKVLEGVKNPTVSYFYQANQHDFGKIPGNPISYWVSENLLDDFIKGTRMDEIVTPKQGLATADNNRFLRQWWEVDIKNIKFDATSIADSIDSRKKWFPYNKGGSYRKWYGNYDYVVNWENDGEEIRNFVDDKGKQRSVVRNPSYYFKEAITWGKVSSSTCSFRWKEQGNIFADAGMSIFFSPELRNSVLGLLNSKVGDEVLKILSPTMNYEVGHISSIPFIKSTSLDLNEVDLCIESSKKDWNSFENSWDFKNHFLV